MPQCHLWPVGGLDFVPAAGSHYILSNCGVARGPLVWTWCPVALSWSFVTDAAQSHSGQEPGAAADMQAERLVLSI